MVLVAPRRPLCWKQRRERGATLALRGAAAFLLASLLPAFAHAGDITRATYSEPTTRYAHGVLGDAIEWGALTLDTSSGPSQTIRLPDYLVFEDLAPRLHDLDGDGQPEVITVLTHVDKGAALAVFGESGLITRTPFIGTRNRWLAPLGAGDLLGDGSQVLAYIDRPHLAKTLRLWRYDDGELTAVGEIRGLTNHRIGDDFIIGGIRNCANGDEVVTVDANWQNVVVTSFVADELISRALRPYTDSASVEAVLSCSN